MKKGSRSTKVSGEVQSRRAAAPTPSEAGRQGEFVGNIYDLVSLAALIVSGVLLFSCVTGNYGLCCLPPLAIILGAVGLLSAKQAREPKRTRVMSAIGIGGGALVLLLILAVVALYACMIGVLIAVESFQ
jgi:amino acid transporter